MFDYSKPEEKYNPSCDPICPSPGYGYGPVCPGPGYGPVCPGPGYDPVCPGPGYGPVCPGPGYGPGYCPGYGPKKGDVSETTQYGYGPRRGFATLFLIILILLLFPGFFRCCF